MKQDAGYSPPSLEWHGLTIGTQHYYTPLLHPLCQATNSVSTAWPTASLAMYLPIYVRDPVVVVQVWWLNGATVSGNLDAGIYTETGTQLYHTGSTVQAVVNAPQVVVIPGGLQLWPGRYWYGTSFDNTTATIFCWTNPTVPMQMMFGMQQQASAFPLPTTATFAHAANIFIPHVALEMSTLSF